MQQLDLKVVDEILERYNNDRAQIIAIMQDIQEVYRYLPQPALEYVAKKTGMSESDLYGDVLSTLLDATGLDEKKSISDDGLFSIEIVSCLGACGLSPVVMVNDTVHATMTPDKAKDLVAELRAEG